MTKKRINERLRDLDADDLNGDIDEVMQRLESINKEWMDKGYLSVKIVVDHYYDYTNFYINGERLETETEYEKRVATNKKRRESAKKAAKTRKEKTEKTERALLQKLKEKYNG